jgi:hypothetical protein
MHSLSLRRFAGIAFTSFALATAACGGDDDGPSGPPAPAPADVSGTYELMRLRALANISGGGNGLPVTFVAGSTLTFNSGRLTLNSDGSYELEVEAVFNGRGVTMSDEGTYDVSGNSIDFTPTADPARMKDGTLSGTSMTAETQFGGIPFEINLQK